ncbi:MAG: hypothetical protein VB071_09215 [Lawsonibacter sp.]|nr:hypothetical protein [Lawsonibacter sp.]
METLEFKTNTKTFSINHDLSRTVSLCPTDCDFIKRLAAAYEKLESLQDQLRKEPSNSVLDAFNKADAEIRSQIDYAFGAPVSEIVFGNLPTWAASDGFPIWMNFLLAVFDTCNAEYTAQGNAGNPEIGQLLAKYVNQKRGLFK